MVAIVGLDEVFGASHDAQLDLILVNEFEDVRGMNENGGCSGYRDNEEDVQL